MATGRTFFWFKREKSSLSLLQVFVSQIQVLRDLFFRIVSKMTQKKVS